MIKSVVIYSANPKQALPFVDEQKKLGRAVRLIGTRALRLKASEFQKVDAVAFTEKRADIETFYAEEAARRDLPAPTFIYLNELPEAPAPAEPPQPPIIDEIPEPEPEPVADEPEPEPVAEPPRFVPEWLKPSDEI